MYRFRRTGETWQQEACLEASNTGADDGFGQSVALAGDLLAVGAPREDSAAQGVDGSRTARPGIKAAPVYLFGRDAAGWKQLSYIEASNSGGGAFGNQVALAEDTLIIGAMYESSAAGGVNGDQRNDDAWGSGAVYVFQ